MFYDKQAAVIKVGVIGYGGTQNMGKSHWDQIRVAEMTPLAMTEIDPDPLIAGETYFPCIQNDSSVDEMLERSTVDLVVNITLKWATKPVQIISLAMKTVSEVKTLGAKCN